MKNIIRCAICAMAVATSVAQAQTDVKHVFCYSGGRIQAGEAEYLDSDDIIFNSYKTYYLRDSLNRNMRVDLVSKPYPLINGYAFKNDPSEIKGGVIFFNPELGIYNHIIVGKVFTNAFPPNVEPTFVPARNSLSAIKDLRPCSYSYLSEESSVPTKKHLGFVAQEVASVMPEAVEADEDGTLSVNTPVLLAQAIGAVGELNSLAKENSESLDGIAAKMMDAYCYVKKLDGSEAGTLKCEYFYAGASDGTITVSDLAGNTLHQSVCAPGKGIVEVKTKTAIKSVYVVSMSQGSQTIKSVKITH